MKKELDKEGELKIRRYRKDRLVSLKEIRIVKKMANGGYVLLPKELIGKKVEINFEEDKNGKRN